MNKSRLIVVGPLPPPFHGVTVSTSLVLAGEALRNNFDVDHLDTSDHRDGKNVGRWDFTNLALGVRNVAGLASMLRGARGIVYLPISQSNGAFLRDTAFIRAARLKGWKVAIHLRGSEFLPFYESQGRIFRWWARRTMKQVTSAAVMGESLRGVFGTLIAPERIGVVPNGTPPNVSSLSRESTPTVLFLSNLRRRKGVVEAINAACIAAEQVPEAKFIFAGAWEDRGLEIELRQATARLGDRVTFLAPVTGEAKDDLLASASVLLFPPREPEGHPRVVLEAIAAGLPVVATDRGAIAETIENEVTGFVLPDPNPNALAARLIELLQDEDLRLRMSSATQERYQREFTQEVADRRLTAWLVTVAREQEK